MGQQNMGVALCKLHLSLNLEWHYAHPIALKANHEIKLE